LSVLGYWKIAPVARAGDDEDYDLKLLVVVFK